MAPVARLIITSYAGREASKRLTPKCNGSARASNVTPARPAGTNRKIWARGFSWCFAQKAGGSGGSGKAQGSGAVGQRALSADYDGVGSSASDWEFSSEAWSRHALASHRMLFLLERRSMDLA